MSSANGTLIVILPAPTCCITKARYAGDDTIYLYASVFHAYSPISGCNITGRFCAMLTHVSGHMYMYGTTGLMTVGWPLEKDAFC